MVEKMPCTIATKKMKYVGINFKTNVQNLL